MSTTANPPEPWSVLVVDDEPDVIEITRLSLRGFKRDGRGLRLLSAASGHEAVALLRANPDVAVVLLDVVMENDHAGLDAARAIREELGNSLVRILLRTGQPGAAPERQTIDGYDIDGYLPKAELTATRVYSAVRAALKSWAELVDLERHRRQLSAVHDCVTAFHSWLPLSETLKRGLNAATTIIPATLAVLYLETLDAQGDAERQTLHADSAGSSVSGEAAAQDLRARINRAMAAGELREAGPFETGYVWPIRVHRELGHGWIYLAAQPDDSAQRALGVLVAHLANAVYSTVAETNLRAPRGAAFESLDV